MMRRPRASLRLGHIRSVRDSDRGLDRLPQHGIVVSLVMMVLIVGVALLLVRTRAALEHVKVDSAAMVRFAPTNVLAGHPLVMAGVVSDTLCFAPNRLS